LAARDEKPKPPACRTDRADRLSAALRDNLKRRREQTRARGSADKNAPIKPPLEKD
jgi:hypothetical protein